MGRTRHNWISCTWAGCPARYAYAADGYYKHIGKRHAKCRYCGKHFVGVVKHMRSCPVRTAQQQSAGVGEGLVY